MTKTLHLKAIAPTRTERGLLVGQTGTGKSTLAPMLFPPKGDVLVIDPKGMFGGPGGLEDFQLVRNLYSLRWSRKPRIQLRMHPRLDDTETWDRVFWWIWERKNTFVYVDEINLISPGAVPIGGLRACITTGRERGIGVLVATQRPAGIPRILRTESEWTYAFHLSTDDDLEAVAESMENDVCVKRRAQGHQFWVHRQGWTRPRIMELNLEAM